MIMESETRVVAGGGEKQQKLLDDLLESIKQCQIRFGGKSELATESENVISTLCSRLEAVFQHGLKSPTEQPFSAIRDRVANNLQSLVATHPVTSNNFPQTKSSWPFIKHHLNRHELERYMLLKQVTTDPGRARAWLRSSLNEHSLERYLHMMIGDTSRLVESYEASAFFLDQERSSMLPSMAAGLNSILFAIKIDNGSLNYWPTSSKNDDDSLDGLIARRKPSSSNSNSSDLKLKKKRKGPSQVISFDEGEVRTRPVKSTPPPTAAAAVHNNDQQRQRDDQEELQGKLLALKNSQEDQIRSISPSMTFDDVHLNSGANNSNDDIDIYSKSPTDAISQLSIEINSSSQDQESVTKLTPMKNSEVGALIPLSPGSHDDIMSEDSMSIKSFGEDQDYASAVSSIMATPQPPTFLPTTNDYYRQSSTVSSVASAQNSTLSREDLKQALLSVMERKDELQDQCHSMKKLLEKESTVTAGLKQELNEANRRSKEASDKMQARVSSLARENELLKHQLKKYVGAVQKLRDGPQAHETLADLEAGQEQHGQAGGKYVDYHYEASEYEKKLIQVAEMHGELLEFNEHLQKLLHSKDSLIRRLRHELVDLRGPLPDEDDQDLDTMSIVSEAESNLTNVSTNTARTLINIWIPSVFLSGLGNGTHHVYQVYLRIRDEEWNIYRRYSEFYALHKDLQKKDRLVTAFDFPPKKTVGNRAEKFVEDRRKRLQGYLRQIVNLMVQTNPALLARPDKEQVILLMPFFAENAHVRASGTATVLPPHQRPSLFQRRRHGANEPATQLAL
jgi:sorting nexin-29